MSAQWDRKQKIGFYYGNAAIDLADRLPHEEEHVEASDLLALVAKSEEHLAKIEASHKEVAYLIADLKRMIR